MLFKLVIQCPTLGLGDFSSLTPPPLSGYGKHKDLSSLSQDDVERAIKKLKILGKGFEIILVGKRKLVQSVPTELNQDHTEIMNSVSVNGCTSAEKLHMELGWTQTRGQKGLVSTNTTTVLGF